MSDEESTQEMDMAALRASLAARDGTASSSRSAEKPDRDDESRRQAPHLSTFVDKDDRNALSSALTRRGESFSSLSDDPPESIPIDLDPFSMPSREEALPAFPLDDSSEVEALLPPVTRRMVASEVADTAEATAVFPLPVPSTALPSISGIDPAPKTDEVEVAADLHDLAANETLPSEELPRFALTSVADLEVEDPLPSSLGSIDVVVSQVFHDTGSSEPWPHASPPSMPAVSVVFSELEPRTHDPDDDVDEEVFLELDSNEILALGEIVEEDGSDGEAADAAPPPPMNPSHRPWSPAWSSEGGAPLLLSSAESIDAELDDEERELVSRNQFAKLVTALRRRLSRTDGPNKKAALLLRIARVYENELADTNEAFQTLFEAFELAPDNTDVVAAIDRFAKKSERIGELADKVKKRLVPGAPDDKRVVYLAHLVYWYERVLGRGGEISSFVSEIERLDKVHPIVLKRAAQLAGMNGDVKTQREHLARALERTTRQEERVALLLALASAHATTPDALKYYEAAVQIDPTSIVALQGIKRIGKDKEHHAQVQWALERQVEVAPTMAERIDALLELAELQETKFLRRELASELFERVIEIEPAQPAALKGLERCYHAMRQWPKLAAVLATRAEHTFDKRSKIELLELAAEVHESKLGDAAGAIGVYRDLLLVEPKHRRALGDLSRLYEKIGDWSKLATYRARLAELAPTKRAMAQELVKLGDLLNTPERDPRAAKVQYELAVSADPTNTAGWEALQHLAALAGDVRRVIECLEQRKNHTDVPRQRAAVLVELANMHLAQGDEDVARRCFEASIRADPNNEAAAIASLDTYVAQEKWADAAPLSELLVNAAIRDRDGEALFARLRLTTRIHAALGDTERALSSAIAALDARPDDATARADLISIADRAEHSPTLLEKARQHLSRIAESTDALPVDLVLRLADLERTLGDLDVAAHMLERARRLDPENQEITKELSNVYLAQTDFPRACKLKVDMARNATNADTRFDLFCEAGEIWSRHADELEKAASVFEEARAIKPHDPWLLQTISWIYGALAEWERLVGVLDAMVEMHERPSEKVNCLVMLAEVARDKQNDRARAAEALDRALDIDRTRLDVFEELVRSLTEEKKWEGLANAYRKMIARVEGDDADQLRFLLFHQLGLIYRDRLADAALAYDALDVASRLEPRDTEVRKSVVELLVVTDQLDKAVTRLRSEIDRAPRDPELYAELYELFLRQHSFDKAWCTIDVLATLREPLPEQRRFHEDYPPMALDRVPGQIVEHAWRSHIFHEGLDPALTKLFALLTPAVVHLRYSELRPEHRIGRPFTAAHSRIHGQIHAAFDNASEILSVRAPELLLGDLKAVAPFEPALGPYGSLLVCSQAVEAQSSSLVYIVGTQLAKQRSELAASAFFLSAAELTSLLAMATRISRNETTKDSAATILDASFAESLVPQEREAIRHAVLQVTASDGPPDVKRWLSLADLSSMRAGLLVGGDVTSARAAILAERTSSSTLTKEEKLDELYKFATSDVYSELRGAIGVAVQS